MLAKFHPLWMNIHVNHSNEISLELEQACDRLTKAGIPLGNQSVLLAGVNDNVHIQRKLVQDLVRIRVRPYYLYQCDLVEGSGHFRTPVAKGIEIIEALRGRAPVDKFTGRTALLVEFTRALMAAAPAHFRWVPIQNMTPVEVASLLGRSKVYIDFGAHPGRDRIPREAALCGCVVITGTQGSVALTVNLPLPVAVPLVLRRIETALREYDTLAQRFDAQGCTADAERILRVQGNESELAHYEALRRQALQEAQEALRGATTGQAHLNILAQLTRLRRAACDPRLVTPDLRQPGAKVQAFGELARELVANGHKALVFSQFVDFLGLLREPLDEAGIAYQYLDGSTPAPERSRRVAAFQAGEGSLFLISLKAGGFGLNLTVADYVVIADPWWNPAAEDQASGRAHRIGQQRPVTVYRLVNTGTLEETIVALHERKRELADSVLAAPDEAERAAQAEAAHGAPFKVDELIALMRAQPLGD